MDTGNRTLSTKIEFGTVAFGTGMLPGGSKRLGQHPISSPRAC